MIKYQYFDYLLNLIDSELVDDHRAILDILFGTDFRWFVHNDDNRAIDGLEIRYNFEQEFDISESDFQELMLVPCSVMEVVCGLAIRMDGVMRDPKGAHVDRWFWEMIANLGLLGFSDKELEKGAWTEENVRKVLDSFMDRTYDELGHGGLFPRKYCDKNQKEVELYSQMNGYLFEKYC